MQRLIMQSLQRLAVPMHSCPGLMQRGAAHATTSSSSSLFRAFRAGQHQSTSLAALATASVSGNFGGGQGGQFPPTGHGSSGSSGGGRSGHGGGGAAAMLALSCLSLVAAGPAAAKGKEKPAPAVTLDSNDASDLTVEKVTEMLWKLAGPILSNLGFSGCMGLVAGIALKKIGMFLAVIVGVTFAALQGLAYTGMITVNWSNMQQALTASLDANGDGKLDEHDFKAYMNSGLGVLTAGVPSVGGFLAGFVLGLRM